MSRPASSLICTFGGSFVDPLDLRPEDIRIGDIAHALSMLCRFTGHVRRFYSVAEHSVLVSGMVPQEHALQALLHDASEAYVNDVSFPLKNQPQLAGYKELEAEVQARIMKRFGLPKEFHPLVHEADREACNREGSALVPGWRAIPKLCFPPVRGLAPPAAKKEFLFRFRELTS